MAKTKYPLSGDMSLLADVIGEDNVRKVMIELGGMSLYVPKCDSETIKYYYYHVCGRNAKLTAKYLHVSESQVYKMVGTDKKEAVTQQTLFEV